MVVATEIGESAQKPPIAGQNLDGSSNDTPHINDLESGTNRSALEAVALGAGLFAGIQFAKPRVSHAESLSIACGHKLIVQSLLRTGRQCCAFNH
jgi:hypothetical protein